MPWSLPANRHRIIARGLPRVVATLCLGLLLAACGAAGDAGGSKATTRAPLTAEQQFGRAALRLGGSIAELRGHYLAAKELFARGDLVGARVHADHPVDELYRSFRQVVAERDSALDSQIRAALVEGVALIDRHAPVTAFDRRVDLTAGELMDRALRVVHPQINPDDPAWQSAVAATIANTAAGEYAAAVPKTRLHLVAEYQDSYGFLLYCQVLVGKLGDLAGHRAAVDRQLGALHAGAYRTRAVAPRAPVPATQVRTGIGRILAELEAAAGHRLLPAELKPGQELKGVAVLLDRAVQLYARNQRQQALDAASSAYVDHFEALEADIAAENPSLMKDLERRIGMDVRESIRSDAPLSQLQTDVNEIKQLLPEAERALGGTGQTAY